MGETADLTVLLAHADWLRQLARRLVGPAGADDAVQETYVAALRAPPAAERPARPWLARVLRNATRMQHRGDLRRARREDAAIRGEPTTAEAPDDAVARAETFRMLVEAVLALTEPYRTTLVRHYFDGDSLAAIARRDGVPEATVRGRHQHALEQLRARLDARAGGDRHAWLAALAPLAAPPGGAAVTTTLLGGLIVSKLLLGVAVAVVVVVAGALVAWRLSGPGAPAPAPGTPALASSPVAAVAPTALPAAPDASLAQPRAPTAHVRQLALPDRQRLAEQIRAAHARRAAAALASPSSAAASTGSASVEPETLMAAMRDVLPFLRACSPPVDGVVVHAELTLTGDPDVGTLIDARQLFDAADHPLPAAFDACVRSTFQTLELPPLDAGEALAFTYTLEFGPGSAAR